MAFYEFSHSIVHIYPFRLTDFALDACAGLVRRLQKLTDKEVLTVYHYLQHFWPYASFIALRASYQEHLEVTKIFIPFLISSGKLVLEERNICVLDFIARTGLNLKCDALTTLSVGNLSDNSMDMLLSWLPDLQHLKFLRLSNCVDDRLARVLKNFCPDLEIFDFREDSMNRLSDWGCLDLSALRNLKILLFPPTEDEFDYEEASYTFTCHGIATLLTSLPHLVRLDAPEHKLRDAYNLIYQSCEGPVSLKCVMLHCSGSHLSINPDILEIFSNVQMVSLIFEEYLPCVAEAYSDFIVCQQELSHLSLKLGISVTVSEMKLLEYGARLKYLNLNIPYLSEAEVFALGNTLINLEILVLAVENGGPNNDSLLTNNSEMPFFPHLNTLELRFHISSNLFKLLNIEIKKLTQVHMQYVLQEELEFLCREVIKNNGWQCVNTLSFPCNSIEPSVEFLVYIVENLPFLKILVYEQLLLAEDEKTYTFLRQQGNGLIFLDPEDFVDLPSHLFTQNFKDYTVHFSSYPEKTSAACCLVR